MFFVDLCLKNIFRFFLNLCFLYCATFFLCLGLFNIFIFLFEKSTSSYRASQSRSFNRELFFIIYTDNYVTRHPLLAGEGEGDVNQPLKGILLHTYTS